MYYGVFQFSTALYTVYPLNIYGILKYKQTADFLIFMCGWCVCRFVSMCIEVRRWPPVSVLTFCVVWDSVSCAMLQLVADWLVHEHLWSLEFLPPISLQECWHYSRVPPAQYGFWGINLRSSCLRGKCIIHWATSPDSTSRFYTLPQSHISLRSD